MYCPYGCANGKCKDKPEEEEQEVDADLPCKNIMCALALCQPGQTTIPANPSEGKCCISCEGEPDVPEPNVEEEDYKVVGGNVYCLAPSKDDYIDHQHAEDVTDHHDGEDYYIDHHHAEDVTDHHDGEDYYSDHHHAEDVTDHHDGEDDYSDHHDGGYGEDQHMAEFHQPSMMRL